MKTTVIALTLIVVLISYQLRATPVAGFYLPDSVSSTTFNYKSVDNLVILPAIINDSIRVNLILDTGCRNIVLFGKRFTNLLIAPGARHVRVTGLGDGKGVSGALAVENKITIDIVKGNRIPIVVVPGRSVFAGVPGVDGVIGYEIFSRFEVEINFPTKCITFRPGNYNNPEDLAGFTKVPLTVSDSKPLISAGVTFMQNASEQMNLVIDTGSCLTLLVSTTAKLHIQQSPTTLGRGFNGIIRGVEINDGQLHLQQSTIANLKTAVIQSEKNHYASIGLGLLKDYVLILNYVKGYAALQLRG